jgi:C4-type Zn-finger protein
MKQTDIQKLIEKRNKQIIQDHNSCPACGKFLKFHYNIHKDNHIVEESPVCESCGSKYGTQAYDLH